MLLKVHKHKLFLAPLIELKAWTAEMVVIYFVGGGTLFVAT